MSRDNPEPDVLRVRYRSPAARNIGSAGSACRPSIKNSVTRKGTHDLEEWPDLVESALLHRGAT